MCKKHNNDKADKSSLATVATSGSYYDLNNRPTNSGSMWDVMYHSIFNIDSAGNSGWIRINKSDFTTQLLFTLQIYGDVNETSADLFFNGPNVSYSSLKIPTRWDDNFYYNFSIETYSTYYEFYIKWSSGGTDNVNIYFKCLGW